MQRQPGRLVSLVGRRGYFLLFLALLDMVYAFSIAFPSRQARISATFRFLDEAGSLYFWASLWAAAGLACLVFAFRKTDWPGFAAAMAIKALWAVMFLFGWAFVGIDRGYLTATIWGAFGLLVWLISTWPEPDPAQTRKMTAPKS
jgi:hypothetical protein